MTGEKSMQCPNPSCQSASSAERVKTELVMSERSGIEIDYCPRCRGIWLDRGELDKLLEKAAKETESARQSQRNSHDEKPRYNDRLAYKKHDDDNNKYKHSGSRKKSLLSELFDF